jgi:hypothetical protein
MSGRHTEILVGLLNVRTCKVVAEVGVYQGATAKAVLKHCPNIKEYHMIDPWGVYTEPGSGQMGKRTSETGWEDNYQKVCGLFKDEPKFHIHRKTSVEGAKLFQDNFFDCVFIDAIHSYKRVQEDIRHWLPKIKKGGFLAGDDVNQPEVEEAVHDFFGKGYFENLYNRVWTHKIEY